MNRGGSRINDFSPGAGNSKSKTNLDATGISSMALENVKRQGTQGVNFKQGNFAKSTVSRNNT